MKKVFILVCVLLFSFGYAFSQDTDNKSELSDLKRDIDSLKNELEILKLRKDMDKLQNELNGLKSGVSNTAGGNVVEDVPLYPFKKNIFSINFAGSIYAVTGVAIANNYYDIRKSCKKDDGGYFKYIIPGTASLDYYGINLSSERMISSNVSFAAEYGWNAGSLYFADNSTSELKMDYQIIPVAVGFKIYTKKHSPYGFFFYPKIGATIIQASGNIISRNGSYNMDDSSSGRHHYGKRDFYYDSSLAATTNSISINFDYGIYASIEVGFRIPLFRKALSKKKVELGLDVSLFDVGYYIKPYHEKLVDQVSKMGIANGMSDYGKYFRYRIMPLPRVGITFRF